ncbi:PepSY domain-containing protein [Kitasatospora sp. NPDC092948]|uniref:PepSY domain-containing protein n=1 Tax=Kitasatospora sp. NPDC092948 TaxID=3364088 RepID=UPI0037F592C2
MSEQEPQPSEPLPFEPGVEKTARRRRVRLPQRRGGRWALGAAVVLVLGVGVVGAAAVATHHPDRHRAVPPFAMRAPGAPDAWGTGAGKHRGGEPRSDGQAVRRDGAGGRAEQPGGRAVQPGGQAERLAPAALPSVPADQALAKAAGAVPGGKVDALSVVGREGGGSSWAVEVLGADGVRHLVTVDGVDGSITGNTAVNGR